jgi:hypothetical protein
MRGEGGAGAQCGCTSRLYGTKEFSTIGDKCVVNAQASSMPLPCECDKDRWVRDRERPFSYISAEIITCHRAFVNRVKARCSRLHDRLHATSYNPQHV